MIQKNYKEKIKQILVAEKFETKTLIRLKVLNKADVEKYSHLEIKEPLWEYQFEKLVNMIQTNEHLSEKQTLYVDWLFERKVNGNKVYYSEIKKMREES